MKTFNQKTIDAVKDFYLTDRTLARAFRVYLSEESYNEIINNIHWSDNDEVVDELAPILREFCPRCQDENL